MKVSDGGPAFPVQSDGWLVPAGGMSLRDWFAGQALFLMAAYWQDLPQGTDSLKVAEAAYRVADAMITEREKQVAAAPTT